METKRYWYAVQIDSEYSWDTGSFDRNEAMRLMHELNEELEANGLERTAQIAVIDAGFDENGHQTRDSFCVNEIHEL